MLENARTKLKKNSIESFNRFDQSEESMLMNHKNIKMSMLLITIYRFNAISIKIPLILYRNRKKQL